MSVKNVSEVRYFAACNSYRGFVSFYDDVFSGLKRLYIIKGGPGTGKSRLMRDVASDALDRGYRVELYYCSSDPDSLDGLILPELSVGMLDGTAPHVCDPSFPGVRDEIINLGSFWNENILLSHRDEIEGLITQKSRKYVQCYHYLSAAEKVNAACRRLVEDAVSQEKLHAAVLRLLRGLKNGDGAKKRYGLRSAISMRGNVTLPTYGQIAQDRIIIRDRFDTADLFLQAVLREVEKREQACIISPTPLNPARLDAIYIPALDLSVSVGDARQIGDGLINMERFLSVDVLRRNRAKLRFGRRCAASLAEGAEQELSEIGDLHFSLEKIYTVAMDFGKKEAYTTELITHIQSQLGQV